MRVAIVMAAWLLGLGLMTAAAHAATTAPGLEPDGPAGYETSGVLWTPPRPATAVAATAAVLAAVLLVGWAALRAKGGPTTRYTMLFVAVVSAAVAAAWVLPTDNVVVTIRTEVAAPSPSQHTLVGPNGRFETLMWSGTALKSAPLSTPGAYKARVNLGPGSAATGMKDITINVREAALLALTIAAGVAIAYLAYRWLLRRRGNARLEARAAAIGEAAAAEAEAWSAEHPEPWARPWSFAEPVETKVRLALDRLRAERAEDVVVLLNETDVFLQQLRAARPLAARVAVALKDARSAITSHSLPAFDTVDGLLARPPETATKLETHADALAEWAPVLDRMSEWLPAVQDVARRAPTAIAGMDDADEKQRAKDLVSKLEDSLQKVDEAVTTEGFLASLTTARSRASALAGLIAEHNLRRQLAPTEVERRDGQKQSERSANLSYGGVGGGPIAPGRLVQVDAVVRGTPPFHWIVGDVHRPPFTDRTEADGSYRLQLLMVAPTEQLGVQVSDAKGPIDEPMVMPAPQGATAATLERQASMDDRTVFVVAAGAAVASGLAAIYGPTWGSWENWLAALVWGAGIGGGAKAVAALASRAGV